MPSKEDDRIMDPRDAETGDGEDGHSIHLGLVGSTRHSTHHLTPFQGGVQIIDLDNAETRNVVFGLEIDAKDEPSPNSEFYLPSNAPRLTPISNLSMLTADRWGDHSPHRGLVNSTCRLTPPPLHQMRFLDDVMSLDDPEIGDVLLGAEADTEGERSQESGSYLTPTEYDEEAASTISNFNNMPTTDVRDVNPQSVCSTSHLTHPSHTLPG